MRLSSRFDVYRLARSSLSLGRSSKGVVGREVQEEREQVSYS